MTPIIDTCAGQSCKRTALCDRFKPDDEQSHGRLCVPGADGVLEGSVIRVHAAVGEWEAGVPRGMKRAGPFDQLVGGVL